MPRENNLFAHTGNPPLSSFTCDITGVTVSGAQGMSCNITDTNTHNLKEYTFCANRGNCDFTSGLCYCIEGYTWPRLDGLLLLSDSCECAARRAHHCDRR